MSDHHEPNIGQTLRTLREERGFSLRTLARACGLSFNAISRIERGESSPTVATLHQLARALNVPITAFFDDQSGQRVVVIRAKQRRHSIINGVTMESLGTGLDNQQIAPFLVTLPPDRGLTGETVTHSGEEWVFCLEGRLCYQIEDEVIELEAGDSLLFDATQSHQFGNGGDMPTRFLLVFRGDEPHDYHATTER